MINTTSPLVLVSLALFASIFHQTLSFGLPIPTRHEQCVDDGFEGSCDYTNSEDVIEYKCAQLRCARFIGMTYAMRPVYIQRYGKPPVDGTYCGPSRHCVNGVCVYSPENSHRLVYTSPEKKVASCN